jgi:phosphoserine phosphatase
MGYTAEMLAALSDRDLDDVVAETIFGTEPEDGLLSGLGRSLAGRSPEDAGPTTPAGMARVLAAMLEEGFTVAVAPGGVVWVVGHGRELKYVGGGIALSRAVAIAAVLAVQGEP